MLYRWIHGNDTILACASQNCLDLWDIESGERISSFPQEYQISGQFVTLVNNLIFVQQAGSMHVYNINTKRFQCKLSTGLVSMLQVNPNLKVVNNYVFITEVGRICVFDLATEQLVSALHEPGTYYSLNGLHVIGDYAIFAVVNLGIKIWNWRKKILVSTLPQQVPECRFTQAGDILMVQDTLLVSSVVTGVIGVWKLLPSDEDSGHSEYNYEKYNNENDDNEMVVHEEK
eukprot:TRINITY_DN2363_c0_g1_i3.p1 TRINITY_DN2363_c0_g1~~TRINITY_DN2363_c0_g1_i3.p1  ORF type:complete len:230 (+),score=25.84 TRINITY_DN2363_c0_g1_i3:903-1592(+)